MEKRERKEKKQGKARRFLLVLVCAALLIAGAYLWFFVFEVTPLPWSTEEAPEATPLPTAAPEPEPTPEPTLYIPKPEVNVYTAKLWIGEETVRGSLQVHYINSGSETLYSIPFHLYPNTVTPGALTVERLSLDGREAYYVVDNDLMNVPFAVELLPGEDCVIYMDFSVNMYAGEYGADGSLSYLLPAAAVYENGWLTDVLPGEVAYTAPAAYSVIVEGGAGCSMAETQPGHYYGENQQGLTVTLH